MEDNPDERDKSEPQLPDFENADFVVHFDEVLSSAEKTKLFQDTVAVKVSPSLFTSTSKKTSRKRLFSQTETNEPTLPTIGQTKKPYYDFDGHKVHFQDFPDMTYRPLQKEHLIAAQARVKRFIRAESKDSIVVLPPDDLTKNLKNFIPKVVREIGKDGNCFYRAISFALYRTEEKHSELRAFLVDYIREKVDTTSSVMVYLDVNKGPPKEYVDSYAVAKDGTWATEFEMAVMAKALVLNIVVLAEQFDKNEGVMTVKWNVFTHHGGITAANYTVPQILLYNKGGNHFEYVVTVQSAPCLQSQKLLQPCLNATIDISDSSVVASPHPICPKSSEKKKKVLKKKKRVRPKNLSNKSILEVLNKTNEKSL